MGWMRLGGLRWLLPARRQPPWEASAPTTSASRFCCGQRAGAWTTGKSSGSGDAKSSRRRAANLSAADFGSWAGHALGPFGTMRRGVQCAGRRVVDVLKKDPSWCVLLIGGHSAVGKTTVARCLGLPLGVPWMQADDLRLAFRRAGARLPNGTDALYYFEDASQVWRRPPEALRDALISAGEALAAPLEAVIENHVDTCAPLVIEGDGILPSLFSRPSVLERAATGAVRSVFLVEPSEAVILENIVGRGRGIATRTQSELRTEARAKWLLGRWLAREAALCNLPLLAPRPWNTLVERISERLSQPP